MFGPLRPYMSSLCYANFDPLNILSSMWFQFLVQLLQRLLATTCFRCYFLCSPSCCWFWVLYPNGNVSHPWFWSATSLRLPRGVFLSNIRAGNNQISILSLMKCLFSMLKAILDLRLLEVLAQNCRGSLRSKKELRYTSAKSWNIPRKRIHSHSLSQNWHQNYCRVWYVFRYSNIFEAKCKVNQFQLWNIGYMEISWLRKATAHSKSNLSYSSRLLKTSSLSVFGIQVSTLVSTAGLPQV